MAEIVATYRIDAAAALSALDQVDQKVVSIQDHLNQSASGGSGFQRISQEASGASSALQEAGQSAANTLAEMLGLEGGVNRGQAAFSSLSAALGEGADALGVLAAGATAAAAAISEAAVAFGTFNSEVGETYRMSTAFNLRPEEWLGLKDIFEQLQVSGEGARTLMMRMSMGVAQLTDAEAQGKEQTGKFAQGLRELGIDVETFLSADTSSQLKMILDGFRQLGEQGGKTAEGVNAATVATNLFGRAGSQNVAILMQQNGAYDENVKRMKELGIGSEQNTQSWLKWAAASHELEEVLMAIQVAIGAKLAPVMTDLASKALDAVETVQKWGPAFQAVGAVISGFGSVVHTALATAEVGFGLLTTAIGYTLEGMSHLPGQDPALEKIGETLVSVGEKSLKAGVDWFDGATQAREASEKAKPAIDLLGDSAAASGDKAQKAATQWVTFASGIKVAIDTAAHQGLAGGLIGALGTAASAVSAASEKNTKAREKEASDQKRIDEQIASDQHSLNMAIVDGKNFEAEGYGRAIDLERAGDSEGAKAAIASGQEKQKAADNGVAAAKKAADEAKKSADDEAAANRTVDESYRTLAKDIQEFASVGTSAALLDPEQTKAQAAASLAVVQNLAGEMAAAAAARDTERVKSLRDELANAQSIYQEDLNNYKTAVQQKEEADRAAAVASLDAIKQTQSAWSAAFSGFTTGAAAGGRGVSPALIADFTNAQAQIQSIYSQIAAIDRDLSDNTIAPDRRKDLENTKTSLEGQLGLWTTYAGQVQQVMQLPTEAEHTRSVEQARLSLLQSEIGIRQAALGVQQAQLQATTAQRDAERAVADEGLQQQINDAQLRVDEFQAALEPSRQLIGVLQSQRDVLADENSLIEDNLAAQGLTADTDVRLLELQRQKDAIEAAGGKAPQDLTKAISQEEARNRLARDNANIAEAGNKQADAALKVQQDTTKLAMDKAVAEEKTTTNIGGRLTMLQQEKKIRDDSRANEDLDLQVQGKVLAAGVARLGAEAAVLNVQKQQLAIMEAQANLKKTLAEPTQGQFGAASAGPSGPNTISVPSVLPPPAAAGQQAQPVGNAISAGIAQGITERSDVIGAAARQVVERAILAARVEAGIASPSARAAAEIGLPLAQGAAVGILSGAQLVASAMGATVASAFSARLPTPMLATSSVGGGGGGIVSGPGSGPFIGSATFNVANNLQLEGLKGHLSQLHAASLAARQRGLGFPNNFSNAPQI